MKAKVLIVFIAGLSLYSCSKDLYGNSPVLTFTSVNATIVPFDEAIDFKFQVTDKLGNIQDSMWMQRISFISDCVAQDSIPVGFSMPQFTGSKDIKATVDINLTNGNSQLASCIVGAGTIVTDSCYFKFWMKDNNDNVSDTVISPHMVLLDSL